MSKKMFTVIWFLAVLAFQVSAQKSDKSVSKITVPGTNWALEVSLPDFEVKRNAISADNQNGRLDASIENSGFLLTIMWLKTSEKGDSKTLRDLASNNLKQNPIEKDGFTLSDYKDFPMLEYLIKEFRGVKLNQKHWNGYIAKDGVWIDIHLSKVLYEKGDEKRFFAILDSVKFVETKLPDKNAGPQK